MGIDVRSDCEVALTECLPDASERDALVVEQADSTMPQVVGEKVGTPAARHALAIAVRKLLDSLDKSRELITAHKSTVEAVAKALVGE